jgi:hypothetical protein
MEAMKIEQPSKRRLTDQSAYAIGDLVDGGVEPLSFTATALRH